MKRSLIVIKVSLAFCFITLIVTLGDYLALNDIWHDYVSRQVIETTYGGDAALNLPDWSNTSLEWQMVRISGLMRMVYLPLSFAALVLCLKALRKKA